MEMFEETFPSTADTVAGARAFVTTHLGAHPDADDIRLCVSEAAQNAVRHGTGPSYTVSVHVGNDVTVCVVNTGGSLIPRQAASRLDDLEATSGRGLALMRVLATAFGHATADGATAVWFTFPQRVIV